mmetsp:Transcript_64500/g.171994  ORF Transcript_64500/g.171994 Transcript_64500/m.171994 type:complete len:84 (-) Transcript_64500:1542-1793(-)
MNATISLEEERAVPIHRCSKSSSSGQIEESPTLSTLFVDEDMDCNAARARLPFCSFAPSFFAKCAMLTSRCSAAMSATANMSL